MSGIGARLERWRAWWLYDDGRLPASGLIGRVGVRIGEVARNRAVTAVVPVVFVLSCASAQLLQHTGPTADRVVEGAVVSALLAAPLAVRQKYPLITFGLIALVALLQWAIDLRLVADIALLIAIYTVAAAYPPRAAWGAAAIVELGAVLAVLRWQPPEMRAESLVLLTAPIVAAACAGIISRQRKAAARAAVEGVARAERERLNRSLIDQANERARIAREMHDVVAHGLSMMVTLNEGALAKFAIAPDEARRAMTQVSATGRTALASMRDLVGVLRADGEGASLHPQPGIEGLPELAEQVRRIGVSVELSLPEASCSVDDVTSLSVYRIVQESLTNAVQHGVEVGRIGVEVHCDATSLVIEVTDDGKVAAAQSINSQRRGHGLAGIVDRARSHGGWADAGPMPVGGWRVRAEIPLSGDR